MMIRDYFLPSAGREEQNRVKFLYSYCRKAASSINDKSMSRDGDSVIAHPLLETDTWSPISHLPPKSVSLVAASCCPHKPALSFCLFIQNRPRKKLTLRSEKQTLRRASQPTRRGSQIL